MGVTSPNRNRPLPGLGRLPRQRDEETEALVLAIPQAEGGSDLERLLLAQIRRRGLPEPEREFGFDPRRGWKFDFCWPALKLAVEVEGGVWTGGRHNRSIGFQRDCEKYNRAAIMGWMLLRYPEGRVRDGQAAAEIEQVVRWRQAKAGGAP